MQHVKSHEQSENGVNSNNFYAHEKSGSLEAMRDDIGNKKKIKSQGPQESSLLPPPRLALRMDVLNHIAVFLSIFLILYVFKSHISQVGLKLKMKLKLLSSGSSGLHHLLSLSPEGWNHEGCALMPNVFITIFFKDSIFLFKNHSLGPERWLSI